VLTKTGINKFNTYTEKATLIEFPKQYDSVYKINDFDLDKNQNLWIARSDGLFFLDNNTGEIKRIDIDRYTYSAHRVLIDHLNNVWVGSEQEFLLKYNYYLKEWKVFPISLTADHYKEFIITDIHEDQEYNLWIALYNSGIAAGQQSNVLVLEKGEEEFRPFNDCESILHKNDKVGIVSNVRRFMSTPHKLYVVSTSNSFSYIDIQSKKIVYFPEYEGIYWDKEIEKSVLFVDSKANIWIGTNGNGLFIYPHKSNLFKSVSSRVQKEFSIKSVRCFLEYHNDIYIGGYTGLCKMNKKTKKLTKIRGDHAVYCMEIYPGDSTSMLIGTEGNGLIKLNLKTERIEKLSNQFIDKGIYGESGSWIYRIFNDGDSVYYFGTMKQIYKYQLDTKKTIQLIHSKDIYSFGNILDIYRDINGRLFAGSTESGLLLFNDSLNEFQPYTHPILKEYNFKTFRVNHINQTKDDSALWVSTEKGLIEINGQQIRLISNKQGLLNDYVYAAIPDDYNNMWLSTNDGVYKYNRNSREIVSFTIYDGLVGNEFNTAAYYKTKNNSIYFGGVDGFSYFNPGDFTFERNEQEMEIINVFLNNTELKQDKTAVQSRSYFIPADIEFFKLEFTALNHIATPKIRYKYKLIGLHDDWIHLGNKNEISFHALAAGVYQLEVLAADHHGNWNTKPLTLRIEVEPYFYETIFFKFGRIVVLILLITLFLSYRYRLIKKQKIETEKIVAQRTAELSKVNKELIKANETKDKFLTIISHDIKNPLAAAQSVSSDLIENDNFYSKKERNALLGVILRSMQHLQALLSNLSNWSKLQHQEIKAVYVECDLQEIIENNIKLANASLIKKHIDVKLQIDQNIKIHADFEMLNTILRNLISNAIKFSFKNTVIHISAQKKKDIVEIQIEDSGVGMTEEQVKNLFVPGLSQSLPGTDNEQGTGFGLLMVKDFMELNKGTIDVVSQPQKGSRFILSFPA
jgi:signal transduction histidine kinase/ligand-binding sensor domain-containing protein